MIHHIIYEEKFALNESFEEDEIGEETPGTEKATFNTARDLAASSGGSLGYHPEKGLHYKKSGKPVKWNFEDELSGILPDKEDEPEKAEFEPEEEEPKHVIGKRTTYDVEEPLEVPPKDTSFIKPKKIKPKVEEEPSLPLARSEEPLKLASDKFMKFSEFRIVHHLEDMIGKKIEDFNKKDWDRAIKDHRLDLDKPHKKAMFTKVVKKYKK